MIITTKTTVAFKVPNEYKQAIEFMKEHPNWKDESDTNTLRYTNVQSVFTASVEESEVDE